MNYIETARSILDNNLSCPHFPYTKEVAKYANEVYFFNALEKTVRLEKEAFQCPTFEDAIKSFDEIYAVLIEERYHLIGISLSLDGTTLKAKPIEPNRADSFFGISFTDDTDVTFRALQDKFCRLTLEKKDNILGSVVELKTGEIVVITNDKIYTR